jgi:glycine/betaine/sarcosine/D-proline reductase family selenoprotein B
MTKIDLLAGTEPFDVPVAYMQRTRDYYLKLGFDNPYRWSHYRDVPFTTLRKPLAKARIGLVTTASPFQPDKGDQGPGAPYNSAAKFYKVYSGDTSETHDVRISHVGIDRKHTTAEDSGTWFPLPVLKTLAAEGVIGSVAPRFHGLPTNRSQATTVDVDVPEIVKRCKEDGVDGVILVPNCPVCHQCAAIAARHLEAAGIATVVMGCARDIVELCGVPRLLFSDFPLGNACGRPRDPVSQRQTLEMSLRLLEQAPGPRTTMQSPIKWASSADWKNDYLNLDRMPADEVARRRADVDQQKAVAKQVREASGLAKNA